MRWLTQLFCVHERHLFRSQGRIALKCWKCDHETPGWTTGPPEDATPKVVAFQRRDCRLEPSRARRVG